MIFLATHRVPYFFNFHLSDTLISINPNKTMRNFSEDFGYM
jgi:hypothetical protein